MRIKGKLVIHGAGGCGISVLKSLSGQLINLGEGFTDIEFRYIDTSLSNVADPSEEGFFKVETNKHGDRKVEGSGGDRQTNPEVIIESVKKYLDKFKYTKQATGEFHVVLSSASGGSGAVIGPSILRGLSNANIPVVYILVGDTGNTLYSANTGRTIATLDNIARNANKAINVVYLNNQDANTGNSVSNMKKVDLQIFRTLTAFAAFGCGYNEGIDQQDFASMLDPKTYKTIEVPATILSLTLFTSEDGMAKPSLPDFVTPLIGRTLTVSGKSPDHDIHLYAKKDGLLSAGAVEILGNAVPIHLISYANYFTHIAKSINDKVERDLQALSELAPNIVTGGKSSTFSDDGDFVL